MQNCEEYHWILIQWIFVRCDIICISTHKIKCQIIFFHNMSVSMSISIKTEQCTDMVWHCAKQKTRYQAWEERCASGFACIFSFHMNIIHVRTKLATVQSMLVDISPWCGYLKRHNIPGFALKAYLWSQHLGKKNKHLIFLLWLLTLADSLI